MLKRARNPRTLLKRLRHVRNMLAQRDVDTRTRTGCLETGDRAAAETIDDAIELIELFERPRVEKGAD